MWANIAELAFIIFQGQPFENVQSTPILRLSPSQSPYVPPSDIPLPQFLKFGAVQKKADLGLIECFDLFRTFGPLASLHVDADLGLGHNSIVVRYWHSTAAEAAEKAKVLKTESKQLTGAVIQTYDPCNLYLAVSALRP